jgi:hypothetical protein
LGKKSTPAAPTPPDPVATANAQADANKGAAITQANLNRIDQVTPQGSIRYTSNGTNADGTPKYTSTQTYSNDEQRKYDQANQVAMALNGVAIGNVDRVRDAQATPFNYDKFAPMRSSVPGAGAIARGFDGGPELQRLQGGEGGQIQRSVGPNDFSADGKRIADSVYNQATSRLDPRFAQRDSDMKSALANRGITENSDAYRRELDNFGRDRNDAYNAAQYSAQQAGANEQSRLFGLELQKGSFANTAQQQGYDQATGTAGFNNNAAGQQFGQNQAQFAAGNTAQNQQFNQNVTDANFENTARGRSIEEATYLRNLPLNDIASLLGTGSGVQNPNFANVSQVGVAAPDYQGAVYANYNAANDRYKTDMQNRSSGLGSIFGLAGSLGSAAIMSDRRLKENVKAIGIMYNRVRTYCYNYIGDASVQFGVMAQDLLGTKPEAVIALPNGYMAVDYRKVW